MPKLPPNLITGVTAKFPPAGKSLVEVFAKEERKTIARGVWCEVNSHMNKTEALYATYLQLCLDAGGILWWKFEYIKLRLADGAFYTPDFVVMLPNLELEFHEVKGFFREAAKVRIKVAASLYPFRFIIVRCRKGGEWEFETVSQ